MHTKRHVFARAMTYSYAIMHTVTYTVAPTLLMDLHYQMSASCETWLIHKWHDSRIRHMTCLHVPWRIHMRSCTLQHILSLPLRWWICIDKWVFHMRRDSSISDMTDAYETWCLHTWHDASMYDNAHCDVYYRVAKTHRIPYLYRSFSAKVTCI